MCDKYLGVAGMSGERVSRVNRRRDESRRGIMPDRLSSPVVYRLSLLRVAFKRKSEPLENNSESSGGTLDFGTLISAALGGVIRREEPCIDE